MLESECHPQGAIAFAEARGQESLDMPSVEEIVLKKFEVVNEEVFGADPPGWPHPGPNDPDPDKGGQRWAQGWPGGCSI